MRPALPLLIASVLLLPAGARAEKFRYKYQPGQVVQYQASMAGASMMGQTSAQMMKASFRLVMRHTQRVRSVSGGVVTLEIRDLPVSGTMTSMGRTEKYTREATTSIVRLTQRGRFLSRKSSTDAKKGEGPSTTDGLDALYGLNFPDRDLKPGDTWEDTLTVGTGAAAQKVRVKSRYVGPVSFRGKACAKFTTTLATNLLPDGEESAEAVPGAQGRMTGTLTTYFDPVRGLEIYSSGSVVMLARADLGQVSPEAGEIATVTKINVVQSLARK